MTNPKGDDFRKYRDIAPEGVEDDAILNLIKRSDGNHAAITAAIENMWHDLPDKKAVDGLDEWNTASKSKSKKDAIAAQQALLADRGGRGGRGPQAGGRGQGGRGGGDRAGGRGMGPAPGRGASMARPAAPVHQPTARPAAVAAVESVAQPPAAVFAAPTFTAPVASTGSCGWGSGGTTLAEKLKQAEILKLNPPAQVAIEVVAVEEEVVVESITAPVADVASDRGSRRPRGRAAGPPPAAVVEPVMEAEAEADEVAELVVVEKEVEELIAQVIEPAEEPVIEEAVVIEVPVFVVEVPVVVAEPVVQVEEIPQIPVSAPFLKMGKWEAPLESSPFQFGSFGNFSTPDVPMDPVPWGGAAVEEQQSQSDAAVWNNNIDIASSSSGPSAMSSLFPVTKGLPSVSEAAPAVTSSSHIQNGRYDQKPSAPPGLEMSKPLARQDSRSSAPGQQSRSKHEANQQQQQQQQPQLQQQQQYQQSQYQQQAPAATPAARGQPPAASPMLYGYAPGFESQYQQPSYGQPAPIAPSPVTDSPVAATGPPPAQGQGQGIAQAPQTLQYGPPPGMANHYVNPYYSSPYYSGQYFYGQPVIPNPYYGQGRGDYQNNRYGTDPYAPGGQYAQYHQGGGFPDQGMPMQQHPSMTQSQAQGQSGAAAAPGAPAGGQSKQKGVSASVAAPQQQDPNQGYGYNHYNPREGQWQQQYQGGWQAPMMGFPGVSPTAGGPQGFTPPQQQSGQGQGHGQRPGSSGYGGPPGQGQQGQGQQFSSRGPAPNAAGPSSGSSASHNW